MKIREDDLTHPKVIALLSAHLEGMHRNSPAEHVHALDLSGLKHPDVSFWTVWDGDQLMGCGAMKELDTSSGEIKSMRTHEVHLRKGVAAALLEHIIRTAGRREYKTLSLETGHGPAFEPALNLYRKYGFKKGEPFAQYEANAFSQFFHLYIDPMALKGM